MSQSNPFKRDFRKSIFRDGAVFSQWMERVHEYGIEVRGMFAPMKRCLLSPPPPLPLPLSLSLSLSLLPLHLSSPSPSLLPSLAHLSSLSRSLSFSLSISPSFRMEMLATQFLCLRVRANERLHLTLLMRTQRKREVSQGWS